MKNHDEFRKTIFEKANAYESARRSRNKKIIEITSLCSITIALSFAFYIGLFPFLNGDITYSDTTNDDFNEHQTMASTSPTQTTQDILETTASTAATVESTFTTTSIATSCTTIATTQTETFRTDISSSSVITETTEPIDDSSLILPSFHMTADQDFLIFSEAILTEITTYEKWLEFLDADGERYSSFEENEEYFSKYNEAYFKENSVIILQYCGYTVESGKIVTSTKNIVFQIHLEKQTEQQQSCLCIFEIKKDEYTDIIINRYYHE